MSSKKEKQENRALAQRLIKLSGQSYEEWLDAQHKEVIAQNQAIILKALDRQGGSINEKG